MIGAPAGQPEFSEWTARLGSDGGSIPFLRYRPDEFGAIGSRVEAVLSERLATAPSFVAFEGYDTILVLAEMLRAHGEDRAAIAAAWSRVTVEGTRGQIRFRRVPGVGAWQWAWAPLQVVDRDPARTDRFRVLRPADSGPESDR
jgi:hypothetical protein